MRFTKQDIGKAIDFFDGEHMQTGTITRMRRNIVTVRYHCLYHPHHAMRGEPFVTYLDGVQDCGQIQRIDGRPF